MQCFEDRHSAKKDSTIVHAHRAEKHTTRSRFSEGAEGQLSFQRKTGTRHPRWHANNLLTFSSTSL